MRIAVLAHLHHPISPPFAGGMEAHTYHLVSGLMQRGHAVTLFAKEGSRAPGSLEAVLEAGFVVGGYPDDDGQNRQHHTLDAAMSKAASKVRNGSFDAVVNNSLSPVPHRMLASVPTLHVLHTPVLPRLEALFASPDWSPDPAHRFATVSQSNADQWRGLLPSIVTIHNGIDPRPWDLQIPLIIGSAAWSGRITPEKGTHLAIAAARQANMKLLIAGPIQDHDYFSSMIAPELDGSIRYLGHLNQSELAQMISSCEVFISSPMWEEPFGLTTLEAMACGTPIAALPAGAMPEIIGPKAGVIASSMSAKGLEEAIRAAKGMDRIHVRESALNFFLPTMIGAYEHELRNAAQAREQWQR